MNYKTLSLIFQMQSKHTFSMNSSLDNNETQDIYNWSESRT